MHLEKKIRAARRTTIEDAVAHQLSNLGKPRSIDTLDVKSIYDALYPEEPNPQRIEYTSSSNKSYDVEKFLGILLKNEWNIIRKVSSYVIEEKRYKDTFYLLAKEPGYLLAIPVNYKNEDTKKKNDFSIVVEWNEGETWVNLAGKEALSTCFTFYYANTSPEDLEKNKKILEEAYKNTLLADSDDASIGIISADQGEFYVRRFSLQGKTPPFLYPDLHYGMGFTDFHNSLLKRVENSTKGLILLHGEPGTGKTQYIRVMLKELARMNKAVLYAPPSLSASLTDPNMMEFIS